MLLAYALMTWIKLVISLHIHSKLLEPILLYIQYLLHEAGERPLLCQCENTTSIIIALYFEAKELHSFPQLYW